MDNVKKIKKNRIFFKYILSYFWILLIALFLSIFIYFRLANVLKERTETYNYEILKQFQLVMDEKLKSAEQLARNLALTDSVNRMLYVDNDLDSWEIYNIAMAIEDLSMYNFNDDFILDFYVYYLNSGLIINNTSKYSLKEFYQNNIYYTDRDLSQWEYLISRYNNQTYLPISEVVKDNEMKNVITYIQSIPFNIGKNYGNIVILIDSDNLLKVMKDTSLIEYGTIIISNSEGNRIYSSKDNLNNIDIASFNEGVMEYVHENESYVLTCLESKANDWKYISLVPLDYYNKDVNRLKNEILIIIAIAMIASFALSIFLTSKNISPIKKLVENLKYFNVDNFDDDDAFKFINRTANAIIKENGYYKEKLELQQLILKQSALEQLLRGYIKESELEEALESADIKFLFKHFLVAMVDISNYGFFNKENLSKLKYSINDILFDLSKEYFKYFLIETDENEVAILVNSKMDERSLVEEFSNICNEIKKRCKYYFSSDLSISIGDVVDNVSNISNSYENARSANEYGFILSNNRINDYTEIQKNLDEYRYNSKVESKLLTAIKLGSKKETIKIVDEIWEINFYKTKLSLTMIKLLYYDLYGTLKKIENIKENISKRVLQEEIFGFNGNRILINSKELKKIFITTINEVCDYIAIVNADREDYKMEAILEYIDDNLDDQNLCLNSISDEFDLTTSYLSFFFKKKTDKNFSTYLREIRINRAKVLLDKGELSIKEIAAAVGYVNSNVFIRNFKKVLGITPGTYRK